MDPHSSLLHGWDSTLDCVTVIWWPLLATLSVSTLKRGAFVSYTSAAKYQVRDQLVVPSEASDVPSVGPGKAAASHCVLIGGTHAFALGLKAQCDVAVVPVSTPPRMTTSSGVSAPDTPVSSSPIGKVR